MKEEDAEQCLIHFEVHDTGVEISEAAQQEIK